jgi:ribonuclease H / adenosylcobalamin/alpha-ribazole phosphatase
VRSATGSWSGPTSQASDHVPTERRVLIEADGGSRGNPGPAGFGAVLKDADTGDTIAEAAAGIGRASNNVAEYRGLIAGLELFHEHTPSASLEVRMDSKLVIEQMAGRWRVRHPDMRPLALAAQRLAPPGTRWTWVPRERNHHADRLANLAMDAAARGETYRPEGHPDTVAAVESEAVTQMHPLLGWRGLDGTPTRIVLLRHGETRFTVDKQFSGPGGEDLGLTELGVEQATRAADALRDMGGVDVLLSSPLRRALETADVVSASHGVPVDVVEGFQESRFGSWDGHTLSEVEARWPAELAAWLRSRAARPPGGESVNDVATRVEAALATTLDRHRGQTVVIASHVTPIKVCIRHCLQAPWEVTHRMLVAPGSLTTLWFYDSGASVLRSFSATL